jgi:hypothetical protein
VSRPPVQAALFTLPKTMMESADMIVILNARGTVLLNPAFYQWRYQGRVVALAMLAADLWNRIMAAVEVPDTTIIDGVATGTSTHRRAWM